MSVKDDILGEVNALEGAVRVKPSRSSGRDTSIDPRSQKTELYDPTERTRLQDLVNDPIFDSLHGKWSDRQQHGRLTYEAMLKHGAVSAGLDGLISFLTTYKPLVKPRAKQPTDKQKEIAEFAQLQLERLGADGDPNQGYHKFLRGLYGGALTYGFSLGEIVTEEAPYREKGDMVQLRRVAILPQASLDSGYQPREEFGETNLFTDPRYRCFDLNAKGRVDAVKQYRQSGGERGEDIVTWEGEDLQRLIHCTHDGSDGNPYGRSLLYAAFYAWADLYTLEQLENVFLDYGLPYLTSSYKSDGRAAPELHNELMDIMSKQDPGQRLLMGPDMTFGSVSASNDNFTEHITRKKKELRDYISQALLMPQSLYSEAGDREADARNLISVFFKYIAPSYLQEWSNVLNHQLLKRLIDANYTNLTFEDYPKVTFSTILDNDLRVMQTIFQQVMPHIDREKLGEAVHAFLPHFDPEWIPDEPKDAVGFIEGELQQELEPVNGVENPPPPKEDGEVRRRMDSQTENPSGRAPDT